MSQIKIEVTEKGIKEADKSLEKLGKTGDKTEKQMNGVKSSLQNMGQKGSQAIALLDGPMGGISSRVSGLTTLLGTGAGGLAGAMTAAVGASYAMAAATASAVTELDNMARLSGVSITQFQQMSFAAQQYGFSADKLANAFKDAKERVGDFIATGGGPLQDFADVMGMTEQQTLAFAKSVEDLSGREVLTKMVEEMEAAGKSGDQMSFALEGMASDMTMLMPLLTNGASELSRLESEMSSVQNPLSEEDVDRFRAMNESVSLVSASFKDLMTNAVIPLLEPFTKLNEAVAFFFSTLNEGTENQIAMELVETNERIIELEQSIENTTSAWGRFKNVATFEAVDVNFLNQQLEEAKAKSAELQNKLIEIRTGGTPSSTTGSSSTPTSTTPTIGEAKIAGISSKETDQIAAQIEALKQSYMTQEELAVQKLNKDLELINAATLAEQEAISLRELAYEAYYEKLDEMDATRLAKVKSQAEKEARAEEQAAKEKERFDKEQQDAKLDLMGATSNALASILGRDSAAYKAAATTEAIISTYLAANKALANPGGPAGIALAGVAVATGMANVAQINAARFNGGDVSAGSGYKWQERDGEAFIPKVDGRVYSKNDMKDIMSGGGQGVTLVNNIYNQTDANVISKPNAQGGEDIYITRDEFPSLMANEVSNPNSDFNQAFPNTWSASRS